MTTSPVVAQSRHSPEPRQVKAKCKNASGEVARRKGPRSGAHNDTGARQASASRRALVDAGHLGDQRAAKRRRWGAGFAGPPSGSSRDLIADRQATDTLAGGGEDRVAKGRREGGN